VVRIGVVLMLFTMWALTQNVALIRLVRLFRAQQQAESEGPDESA
jgi:hypothetical protein